MTVPRGQRIVGDVLLTVLVAAALVSGLAGQTGAALAVLTLLVGAMSLNQRAFSRRVSDLADRAPQSAAESERQIGRLRSELADERRAAAARQQALVETIERERGSGIAAVDQLGDRLAREQHNQTREVEALLQLFRGFEPRAPMPPSGNWALNPTGLLQLGWVVGRRRPRLVLELGSGTSSVWLAYAVERCGGRVVSVDHDPDYAEQTRAQLRRHGLDQLAEVRDAPLRGVTVAEETFHWYDPRVFADLSQVDLLVVDGPPGATGPRARYPALPLLAERLSPGAAVLLDDADRPHEREILRQWLDRVPGLTQEPATPGQMAVLRLPVAGSADVDPDR